MTDHIHSLFHEYAARRARGENPDVEQFLARAGQGAAELGRLIDDLLVSTPAPAPTAAQLAAMAAWLEGEPALLAVRTARGRRRAEVVEGLLAALGLPERARTRLADNYHRLETGLLDARRIDARLRDALDAILGVRTADLPLWAPPAPSADGMLARPAPPPTGAAPPADTTFTLASPDPAEAEVDRLFGVP